jgi:catechol 2,3-dioxygenase-like lactoylglutathione lyase family enzyme
VCLGEGSILNTDAECLSDDQELVDGPTMQSLDLAIPILPSRSLADTLAFYRRLGFEGEIHRHGNYAILTRGTVELHFFTHHELRPAESSAACYIRVSDVEGIYSAFASAELPRRGIPRRDTLEDKPWGMREFAIVDPDGNLLRIGQTV